METSLSKWPHPTGPPVSMATDLAASSPQSTDTRPRGCRQGVRGVGGEPRRGPRRVRCLASRLGRLDHTPGWARQAGRDELDPRPVRASRFAAMIPAGLHDRRTELSDLPNPGRGDGLSITAIQPSERPRIPRPWLGRSPSRSCRRCSSRRTRSRGPLRNWVMGRRWGGSGAISGSVMAAAVTYRTVSRVRSCRGGWNTVILRKAP